MNFINETVDIVHEAVTTQDWDDVVAIVGYPGKGKSNLALHIIERWLLKLHPDLTEEDGRRFIALDLKMFAYNFARLKRFDASMHDEAGELSGRNAATKTNKLYMKAYQIVRGENLLTILTLPDLFDLDPYFRKNRVRHMFLVYRRGRCAFWTHGRYKRMVEINERLPYHNYFVVEPDYIDSFPKYSGRFAPLYAKMKAEKLVGVRQELAAMMKELEDDPKQERDEMIAKLLRDGIPITQIAARTGLSRPTIHAVKKRMFKPRKTT